jgi:hypothetical protein
LNDSGGLMDLITSCNKNCYCEVRCPWGCTEFVDECGYIPYYKLFYALTPLLKKPIGETLIASDRKCYGRKDVLTGSCLDYLA